MPKRKYNMSGKDEVKIIQWICAFDDVSTHIDHTNLHLNVYAKIVDKKALSLIETLDLRPIKTRRS